MKKEPLPGHKRPEKREGKVKRIFDTMQAEPHEWFDVTDEATMSPSGVPNIESLRTRLAIYAGWHFSPLELSQRNKKLYARWSEEKT